MSDKLNSAMRDQAEAAGFAPVDLDAVIAGGTRRVRRRRRTAGAVGVAGLAAAVALAVTLSRPDEVRTAPDPAEPYPTSTRSFEPYVAEGPHLAVVGSPDVVLDQTIDRLVQDADGFGYLADQDFDTLAGTIHAYVDGTTTDYGTGSDLNSDQDGHLLAWLRSDGGTTSLVVLDTRTMTTTDTDLQPASGRGREVRLHDVEGGTAYLTDGRGDVALDLVTGRTEPVSGPVVDAEDDVLVVEQGQRARDLQLVAELPSGVRTLLGIARSGVLSPDGRTFATSDRTPPPGEQFAGPGVAVIDTASGQVTELDARAAVDGEPVAIEPGGWLDDDTLSVLWVPLEDAPQQLLSCDVPTGVCQVAFPDLTSLGGPDDASYLPGSTSYRRR